MRGVGFLCAFFRRNTVSRTVCEEISKNKKQKKTGLQRFEEYCSQLLPVKPEIWI